MPVRPFEMSDIPQVADLYWSVLRERKGSTPAIVHSFLRELYFENPWLDPAIPSLVEDDHGTIGGFLGVVPRTMVLRGEPVRIAYGGNFVVHPKVRTTLAGLHLLRTYMAGPQDSSQTDSANDTSRALLERLGFATILPLSVHWLRPLRPARALAYAFSHLTGGSMAASLGLAARPLCALSDWAAAKVSSSPFVQPRSCLSSADLDVDTLLERLSETRQQDSLYAHYDKKSLSWLLSFMERMQGHGHCLRKLVLRDDSGRIVGWYLYYLTRGGVGEVVQIGGPRKRLGEILDHLFQDAWSGGAIALHGTLDRRLMDIFSEKNCFFTCRGGWTVAHSRKAGLMEVLSSGCASLSRLDGEWSLALEA